MSGFEAFSGAEPPCMLLLCLCLASLGRVDLLEAGWGKTVENVGATEKGCGGKASLQGSLGLAPMLIWLLLYWKGFTIPYWHQDKNLL